MTKEEFSNQMEQINLCHALSSILLDAGLCDGAIHGAEAK